MRPFLVDEVTNIGLLTLVKLQAWLYVHPVLKRIINEKGTTELPCRVLMYGQQTIIACSEWTLGQELPSPFTASLMMKGLKDVTV